MEWYLWVLIGVAAVGIGYIKIKILKKVMTKKNHTIDENE